MDRVEAKLLGVELVSRRAAREVRVPLTLVARHLPRQKARRERHDLVATVSRAVRHEEGEHGLVLARGVVRKRQTLGDRLADFRRLNIIATLGLLGAKELGVAAGNVARAHDVAQDEHVLRLGDDRLGVTSVYQEHSKQTSIH